MIAPLKGLAPAVLLLALFLGGCLPPPVADEAKKVAPFQPDFVTIGNITISEAPAAFGWTPPQLIAGPYFDPFVGGWVSRTTFPVGGFIRATRGGTPGASDDNIANFAEAAIIGILTLPDQATSAPATYAISPPPTAGAAVIEYVDLTGANIVCLGASGTLTISRFGAVGDSIVGTFTVDSWKPVGFPCPLPTPTAGSFRVQREIDDRTGNDGSGTDTITATDVGPTFQQTYTESAQPLNDPLLEAYFEQEWDGIAEQIISHLALHFSLGYDQTLLQYQREYTARYYYVSGPGTYPKGGGDSLDLRLNATGAKCSSGVAPLTITALGPVGGLLTGDFLTDATGLSPCPAQFGVTFSVTREADPPILVPALTGDTLSIKGITIAERNGANPAVTANVNLVTAIESLTVSGTRNSPASFTTDTATITLSNPAAALQSPQTYAIANPIPPAPLADGAASVVFNTAIGNSASVPCKGTAGTLTVASYGGAGGRVAGLFAVTADTCGTLAGSGTFSAAIDSVNTFGNNGQGIDTFDVAIDSVPVPGYPRTESTSPLSDPVLSGQFRPSDSSANLVFQSGADRANNWYQFDLRFNIPAGAGAPGTFVEGNNLTTTIAGLYATTCGSLAGSTQVVVTTFPPVGGQITGSFLFVNDSNAFPSCTFSTLTGTFAATREGDDFN